VLRALLGVVAVTAVSAAAASGNTGGVRHGSVQMSVTGEITALGPTRVAIGRFGCTVPPRAAASLGRFVIGDPVKLTCLNGSMRSARYWPEVATGQSYSTHPATLPSNTSHPPSPPFDPANATHAGYSFSTLFLGTPPTFTVLTASGSIATFSDAGITVGDLTCALPSLAISHPEMFAIVHVGDTATITCRGDTDVLTAMKGSR
jgi:hypothetical protein